MRSDYETLRVTRDGPVTTVALNRPANRNAIGGPMMRELHGAISQIAADAGVRVLVLRGEGADFCPGADVKHYGGAGAPAAARPAWSPVTEFQVPVMLHEMPAVTIAAISGACAGAGFGWACACDLRIASETAKFNSAFLDVGVAGDMGGPWTLPRILGAAKARELYFLPGKFDAAEAYRIGLVNRLWDETEFESELETLAERIAGSAPIALKAMKANFVDAERMTLAEFIEVETKRHGAAGASADSREAFRAFVEKRKPIFEGR